MVDEARALAATGVKEINLIAEDTNQYGHERKDGRDLALLLRELGQIEGVEWIRILYAYPSYFSEGLIQEIASNPKAGATWIPPLFACSGCVRVLAAGEGRGGGERQQEQGGSWGRRQRGQQ